MTIDIPFLGLSIRTKATPSQLTTVDNRRGWWPIVVRESYPGAWQQNVDIRLENVLTHPVVFACIMLISSDIAKLRPRLVEMIGDDIWEETDSPSYSPVLRKPNRYQTRIAFFQLWMISKLIHGNTYVLKQRDGKTNVESMFILDPNRVVPLQAPDGSVWYELKRDDLSGQPRESVIVPASEIIHDKFLTLYHPLVGIAPLYAAGLAATQALSIQGNAANFQANGAMPGGILLAPGPIKQEVADAIKSAWETNYSGTNAGRIAVLGDNLKYEPLKIMSAVDSQVIEQLKWADERICGAFLVPAYKVGVGPYPSWNNVEALDQEYYNQCLQIHVESIELLMDEGLGLVPGKIEGRVLGTEFDLDGLLRMDTATLISSEKDAIMAGIKSPNESRQRLNLPPVEGGNSPMMQQQVFSLAALAERDRAKPFAKAAEPPTAPTAQPPTRPAEPLPTTKDLVMTYRHLLQLETAAV